MALTELWLMRVAGRYLDMYKDIDMEHATACQNENYWCALTDGKYKYAWYFRTGREELTEGQRASRWRNINSASYVVNSR